MDELIRAGMIRAADMCAEKADALYAGLNKPGVDIKADIDTMTKITALRAMGIDILTACETPAEATV